MGARLQVQGTQASLPCRIPSPSRGLRAIKEEGTHQLLSFPELLVSELGWLEPWPPPVVEVRFAPPPALGACALLEVSQCSENTMMNMQSFEGMNATHPLEVFIVPHTHADTGWMLTFEQYYDQLVRPILTSTLATLAREPGARYCWAEVAFLARWWQEQPLSVRQDVRAAVKRGQLELVEGGWSQSDEIVASLRERLHNLEAGHDWIGQHIGRGAAFPRLGWKLDPFGGSAVSAAIFRAQRADAYVKMRIPDWMKRSMQAAGQAEQIWRPAHQLGGSGDSIFLHVLESYSSASGRGFDFDQFRTPSPPISPANVEQRAGVFAALAEEWAPFFDRLRGRPGRRLLMLPWGGDFRWQNGSYWFGNMSLLIAHVHAHPAAYGGMRFRFATPSEYFRALHTAAIEDNVSFATSEEVWQPYDGQGFRARAHPGQYMSGIFDSRTGEKLLTRVASTRVTAAAAFRVAAMMRGARPPSARGAAWLGAAKEAVGIGVHHDALPGTSNSGLYRGGDPVHGGFAVQDYKSRLAAGRRMADEALADAVAALVGVGARTTLPDDREPLVLPARLAIANPASRPAASVHRVLVALGGSRHHSTGSSGSGGGVSLVADGVCVYAEAVDGGAGAPHSVPPLGAEKALVSQLTARSGGAWELAFVAEVAPLATRSFSVVAGNCSTRVVPSAVPPSASTPTFSVRGACITATFNSTSGELVSVARSGQEHGQIWQEHGLAPSFYTYSNATRSGSYFFVPHDVAAPVPTPAAHHVLRADGPVISEVISLSSDGLGQRVMVRGRPDDSLACSVRLVATVARPVAYNSELVLRFHSSVLNEGGALMTHNGFTAEHWEANASVGIGGNYHAAVSHTALADAHRSLMVAFDRTHGVASLSAGELEVKLQRNVGGDGEGPACNDTEPVSATMEVSVAGRGAGRAAQDEREWLHIVSTAFEDAPLALLVSTPPSVHSPHRPPDARSPVSPAGPLVNASALPADARVVSWDVAPPLEADDEGVGGAPQWMCAASHADGGAALLRVVNDGVQPTSLDLDAFLQPAPVVVQCVCETTLSGHQLAAHVAPMEWRPSHTSSTSSSKFEAPATPAEPDACFPSTKILLLPRQLLTVRICWQKMPRH